MATIDDLRQSGKLIPYETELDTGEFVERQISFAPSGQHWFEQVLPGEVAYGTPISPWEQVEQILHEYVTGRVMIYETDRKRLEPDVKFVWEFITPHVRVFGWLPQKRHFIVVNGEMKRRLPRKKDYAPFIQQVVDFRNNLDLNEPKQLEGIRANEIC
jgi:hypothetical protein